MRILHTADLHFGQQIYRHYDRLDEHLNFFEQLKDWIREYQPDVLIISGDIFDVAQPPAYVWTAFNDRIVELRKKFPSLSIVIVAGNHDSAARIESHSKVWEIGGVTMIGTPPPFLQNGTDGWEEHYIVSIPAGFIIAIPYMPGERRDTLIHLQEYTGNLNKDNLPVVMTGHLAATGIDTEGHDNGIGNLRTVSVDTLGDGYDYLALGHIHKAQTMGYPSVWDEDPHSYRSPIARYSGSVLHVSEDENYPHSVSLVDIDKHKGNVSVRQLRIRQIRHFVTLPDDRPEPFQTSKDALSYLKGFVKKNDHVYIRFRFRKNADIPADFNSSVYSLIDESGKDIRYNPGMIYVSPEDDPGLSDDDKPMFEVEELKQMANPLEFVRKTSASYPGLSEDDLNELFSEVEEELIRLTEEK